MPKKFFISRVRCQNNSSFMMHDWEATKKARASCFIEFSKHSKTIRSLGLRPRAFISFLVFGNPDETLALVFEILLVSHLSISVNMRQRHFANAKSTVSCENGSSSIIHRTPLFSAFKAIPLWKARNLARCPREEAVARKSVLNGNNTHRLMHALFSLLNN